MLLFLSAVYSQPIIGKAGADLLRSHFLPTLAKLKKKTVKVRGEREYSITHTDNLTLFRDRDIIPHYSTLPVDKTSFEAPSLTVDLTPNLRLWQRRSC